jgi:hypothetical protein
VWRLFFEAINFWRQCSIRIDNKAPDKNGRIGNSQNFGRNTIRYSKYLLKTFKESLYNVYPIKPGKKEEKKGSIKFRLETSVETKKETNEYIHNCSKGDLNKTFESILIDIYLLKIEINNRQEIIQRQIDRTNLG